MVEFERFTAKEAERIGDVPGIIWDKSDVEQFIDRSDRSAIVVLDQSIGLGIRRMRNCYMDSDYQMSS